MQVEGLDYQSGEPIRLEIKEGKITDLVYLSKEKKDLLIIAPGLVDLQVNGYGGVDFNTTELIASDVYQAVQMLAKQGVTNFFPTLITNTDHCIQQTLKTIILACKTYTEVANAISGIHLEGPFISKENGPRGAHDPLLVQKPNWKLFQQWQTVAEGKIKIITLSPEWTSSDEFIARCTESGVIVSIGHTSATPQQIEGAVKAGARLSTHLGNGAHLMLPRHPNYIWEQLSQDKLWVSVIADGFHLPDSFLKVIFKVKPETAILISDCTSFAGLKSGTYASHIGGEVVLSPEGRLSMADQPKLLAGSAQSLLWCINQMVKKDLLSLGNAWDMASLKPLELVTGKSKLAFKIGEPANLVLFEQKETDINILQTIQSGKIVFPSS